MQRFGMGDMETKMAKMIWEKGSIRSGEMVVLCKEEFGWAKSTTYTMLRRLCERGLFQNVNSVVTPVMEEDEYRENIASEFLNDKFEGSLAKFMSYYLKNNKLSSKDKEKLIEIVKK